MLPSGAPSTPTQRKSPGNPRTAGQIRREPTWADPGHLSARARLRLLPTQLRPSEPGAGRPGAPGVRPGSRGVRLLCSRRVLRPPHLGCRRTAAEPKAPRWVRRKVLRQGGPGGPRCGEKCVPGKPRPVAGVGGRCAGLWVAGRRLAPPGAVGRVRGGRAGPGRERRESPIARGGYRPA